MTADNRPKDQPDDDNDDQGRKPNDPTPQSDPVPPDPPLPGDIDNPGRSGGG